MREPASESSLPSDAAWVQPTLPAGGRGFPSLHSGIFSGLRDTKTPILFVWNSGIF